MEWDDLKHVAALAESGSVRRAGSQLGLHGATVARHVERLEARLGVKLFARTRRGMEITAAGRRVLETHARLADALAALERDLQAEGQALAGPATLYVAEALASGWLVPRLREFAVRCPDIVLTVLPVTVLPLLDPGAAAAALVLTSDPPGHLVGRRLGPVAICGYRAAPAPDRGEARVAAPDERLLGPVLPAFADAWRSGGHGPDFEDTVRCPTLPAQLEACRAGLGVAVLPCVVGDALPELMRVEPALPLRGGEAWLLSHPDSRGIARLQALLGYVQEIWTADRARLEGHARDAAAVAHA